MEGGYPIVWITREMVDCIVYAGTPLIQPWAAAFVARTGLGICIGMIHWATWEENNLEMIMPPKGYYRQTIRDADCTRRKCLFRILTFCC